MTGRDPDAGEAAGPALLALVPLGPYMAQMAVGFALGTLVLVPERVMLWANRDLDQRISGTTLALQLVGAPLLVAIGALVLRRYRPGQRERLVAALPEAPAGAAVADADRVRALARHSWVRVLLIWAVLGLVVPFMASSMVALAIFVGISAWSERSLDDREGRQLLCRPRWLVWKPLTWRTISPATSTRDPSPTAHVVPRRREATGPG